MHVATDEVYSAVPALSPPRIARFARAVSSAVAPSSHCSMTFDTVLATPAGQRRLDARLDHTLTAYL